MPTMLNRISDPSAKADFRSEFDGFLTLSVASDRELPMRREERKPFLEDRTQRRGTLPRSPAGMSTKRAWPQEV